MKKAIPLSVLLLFLILVFELPAATKFPDPLGAVNDFASVIQEPLKKKMDDLSREILDKAGTAIVVATIESIGDETVETYASELYRTWGIGKKGQDKGVLILLALKERKVRIETGYGVEGILPDGLVGQILDDSVLPYFKSGQYGEGLYNGLVSVSQVIAKDAGFEISGEYKAARQIRRKAASRFGFGQILILLIFLFFMFGPQIWPWLFLAGMSGRRRPYYSGGGGFGSFGGGGFGGFGGGMSGGGGASRGF